MPSHAAPPLKVFLNKGISRVCAGVLTAPFLTAVPSKLFSSSFVSTDLHIRAKELLQGTAAHTRAPITLHQSFSTGGQRTQSGPWCNCKGPVKIKFLPKNIYEILSLSLKLLRDAVDTNLTGCASLSKYESILCFIGHTPIVS